VSGDLAWAVSYGVELIGKCFGFSLKPVFNVFSAQGYFVKHKAMCLVLLCSNQWSVAEEHFKWHVLEELHVLFNYPEVRLALVVYQYSIKISSMLR